MDNTTEVTPTFDQLMDFWKKQREYTEAQDFALRYNMGLLPIPAKCPACSTEFQLNVPMAVLRKESEKEIAKVSEAVTSAVVFEDPKLPIKGEKVCGCCNKPYHPSNSNVVPIWEALNICSVDCWRIANYETQHN